MSILEDNVIVNLHCFEAFFKLSYNSYKEILEECKRRESIIVKTDVDIDNVCKCNEKIEELTISVIIFSCISIESFINYYGVSNFSKTYFDNYLDKLDIKSKFIIIPRLKTGKQIDTDCGAFENIVKLIVLRNKLVHDKPKAKKVKELSEIDFLNEKNAQLALFSVKGILQELKYIDDSVNLDWIKE